MSRRKDQGEDTPMLDLVASLAGSEASEADPAAQQDEAVEAEANDATADEDPMAGILADAGVSVDDAEAAADAFVEEAVATVDEEASVDGAGLDEEETPEIPLSDPSEADIGETPATPEIEPTEPVDTSDDIAPAKDEKTPAAPASQQQPKPFAPPVGTPSDRILLRQDVLDIAGELEAGRIGKRTAVRRIREVCEDDAVALDLDDIEVDFDAVPEDRSGLSFLAGLGAPKPQAKEVDPVEAALLAAIKLRDRVSALSIVGDTPTAADREAYKDALRKLRDTLATHLPE
jgi:hypothetical protein